MVERIEFTVLKNKKYKGMCAKLLDKANKSKKETDSKIKAVKQKEKQIKAKLTEINTIEEENKKLKTEKNHEIRQNIDKNREIELKNGIIFKMKSEIAFMKGTVAVLKEKSKDLERILRKEEQNKKLIEKQNNLINQLERDLEDKECCLNKTLPEMKPNNTDLSNKTLRLVLKNREKDNFVSWIGSFKLTANFTNEHWIIQLFRGKLMLDSKKIKGNYRIDRFLRKNDTFYLTVECKLYLYSFKIRDDSIVLTEFPPTDSIVRTVFEDESTVLVGLEDGRVCFLENNNWKTLLEMETPVYDINTASKGNNTVVLAIDFRGTVKTVNLTTLEEDKPTFSIKNKGIPFFANELIVKHTLEHFEIFSSYGKLLKQLPNKTNSYVSILSKTKNHTFLGNKSFFCILHHNSLEISFYKKLI